MFVDERAFLLLAHEDAAKSLEREPGCRQFDVCTDPERPGSVLFYEVYNSRDAFEDHKKTKHFKVFDEALELSSCAARSASFSDASSHHRDRGGAIGPYRMNWSMYSAPRPFLA
jgi:quinol monooxygenase YgiN